MAFATLLTRGWSFPDRSQVNELELRPNGSGCHATSGRLKNLQRRVVAEAWHGLHEMKPTVGGSAVCVNRPTENPSVVQQLHTFRDLEYRR